MTLPMAETPILEWEVGDHRVRICFAPQDVPGAEKNLLDSIMQVYRQRVEWEMQ